MSHTLQKTLFEWGEVQKKKKKKRKKKKKKWKWKMKNEKWKRKKKRKEKKRKSIHNHIISCPVDRQSADNPIRELGRFFEK